mgnify:CR=1 FL=1
MNELLVCHSALQAVINLNTFCSVAVLNPVKQHQSLFKYLKSACLANFKSDYKIFRV